MEKLFIAIFNLSISASYLILAVIVVRFLFKKVPKSIICVLWLLVGIRLIIPFSIASIFSLIPSPKTLDNNIIYGSQPAVYTGIHAVDQPVNNYLQNQYEKDVTVSVNRIQILLYVCSYVWMMGMLLMMVYIVHNWSKIKRKVGMAIPCIVNGNKVYRCESIDSPFLFGVMQPRIYIPEGISEKDLSYVILHEKAHISRKDYLIKPIAYAIMTVYWFNPLIWIVYISLCRDIELACDEKVIRNLESDCKKEYSQTLLTCSVSRKRIDVCPVAFGEAGVKERVKNVFNYRKPSFGICVVTVLVFIVISVCFMTQKNENIAAAKLNKAGNMEIVSDQNKEYLENWAQAFCGRDGDAILSMLTKETAESMEKQGLLIREENYTAFGYSSPWPWGPECSYRIVSMDDHTAEILYYALVSDPHITVWREKLKYSLDNGNFMITSENLEYFDAITRAEDFHKAYPDGIPSGTSMDYQKNGMGEALNQNAVEQKESPFYSILFEPDTAACYLLNVVNDKKKIKTTVTTDIKTGEAKVCIQFLKDNSSVTVTMIQPYGKESIWLVQAGSAE